MEVAEFVPPKEDANPNSAPNSVPCRKLLIPALFRVVGVLGSVYEQVDLRVLGQVQRASALLQVLRTPDSGLLFRRYTCVPVPGLSWCPKWTASPKGVLCRVSQHEHLPWCLVPSLEPSKENCSKMLGWQAKLWTHKRRSVLPTGR